MSVKKSDLLIGGQMCPPTSGRYYPLYSPADGTLVAEVADASRADVDRAAAAAREAFYAEWKFCGIGRRYGEMGLEPFFEYKTVWVS